MPPRDDIIEAAWQSGALPLLAAAIVFLLVSRWPKLAALLALAAGFEAGNHFREVITYTFSKLKPLDWLPWITVAAGIAAMVPGWFGVFIKFILSGGVAWVVTSGESTTVTITPQIVVPQNFLILLPLLPLSWLLLDWPRLRQIASPALGIAFFSASGVLLYAHSARLADIAMILGSTAFGIGLVAAMRTSHASAGFLVVLLPLLLTIGRDQTFSDVPKWSFLLVAASPVLLVFVYLHRWWGLMPFLTANMTALILAIRAESLPF